MNTQLEEEIEYYDKLTKLLYDKINKQNDKFRKLQEEHIEFLKKEIKARND